MKKIMIFLLFAVSMTNVVIANVIPTTVKKKKVTVEDVRKNFEIVGGQEGLEELLQALEACHQADDENYFKSCSRFLFLEYKLYQALARNQDQDTDIAYVIENEDQMKKMVLEAMGEESFEKCNKIDGLRRACGEKLTKTMERDYSEA